MISGPAKGEGEHRMRITQDVAKTIVNEISNTINKNVNLMDETGRIIASTASDRVGTFHRGAQKL